MELELLSRLDKSNSHDEIEHVDELSEEGADRVMRECVVVVLSQFDVEL